MQQLAVVVFPDGTPIRVEVADAVGAVRTSPPQ